MEWRQSKEVNRGCPKRCHLGSRGTHSHTHLFTPGHLLWGTRYRVGCGETVLSVQKGHLNRALPGPAQADQVFFRARLGLRGTWETTHTLLPFTSLDTLQKLLS